MNMPQSLGTQPLSPEPPSLGTPVEGSGAVAPPEHCWPVRPTLCKELDTFSVHFYIFFGPSVALPPECPAVFALRLLPVLDSAGILSLELQLNMVCLRRVFSLLGSLKGSIAGRTGPLCLSGSPSRLLCAFLQFSTQFWSISGLGTHYPVIAAPTRPQGGQSCRLASSWRLISMLVHLCS